MMDICFFMLLTVAITTSSFCGKGKKLFYKTWQNCPEITTTFAKLSSITCPLQVSESDFQTLEQFVVSLYSSTINSCEVNVSRRILFAKEGRAVENIPPTLNALK